MMAYIVTWSYRSRAKRAIGGYAYHADNKIYGTHALAQERLDHLLNSGYYQWYPSTKHEIRPITI